MWKMEHMSTREQSVTFWELFSPGHTLCGDKPAMPVCKGEFSSFKRAGKKGLEPEVPGHGHACAYKAPAKPAPGARDSEKYARRGFPFLSLHFNDTLRLRDLLQLPPLSQDDINAANPGSDPVMHFSFMIIRDRRAAGRQADGQSTSHHHQEMATRCSATELKLGTRSPSRHGAQRYHI